MRGCRSFSISSLAGVSSAASVPVTNVHSFEVSSERIAMPVQWHRMDSAVTTPRSTMWVLCSPVQWSPSSRSSSTVLVSGLEGPAATAMLDAVTFRSLMSLGVVSTSGLVVAWGMVAVLCGGSAVSGGRFSWSWNSVVGPIVGGGSCMVGFCVGVGAATVGTSRLPPSHPTGLEANDSPIASREIMSRANRIRWGCIFIAALFRTGYLPKKPPDYPGRPNRPVAIAAAWLRASLSPAGRRGLCAAALHPPSAGR